MPKHKYLRLAPTFVALNILAVHCYAALPLGDRNTYCLQSLCSSIPVCPAPVPNSRERLESLKWKDGPCHKELIGRIWSQKLKVKVTRLTYHISSKWTRVANEQPHATALHKSQSQLTNHFTADSLMTHNYKNAQVTQNSSNPLIKAQVTTMLYDVLYSKRNELTLLPFSPMHRHPPAIVQAPHSGIKPLWGSVGCRSSHVGCRPGPNCC